ncbi:hypothetical protein NAEGRDRAFT_78112 [Naegleria gruberi]|uniref:Uncharacterized protein n=1 Tax=Naegleria gruberi TaxID=5762 RepID=D2V132_NAEGR|nr:uncharacterized protein NAEGRDRAFT_78112 [Naegleria gruberi]EFC49833.1 hypothetical protein NAEGRDRAFT_78112 [Naegleria gruberi]|eukprot:XP_002682577.1 hypothetical protein NAEGRDRAFT_78112 [Naegleria gruberi strain NEG-M]
MSQSSSSSFELNVQSLVQTLIEYNGGDNFHIEAIYLFGSRLYGIENTYISESDQTKSDYDFIIITNRKADEREGINRNNRLPSDSRMTLELSCGENQMDCVVMDVSHFLMDVFIEQHNYKSILPLWLENGGQFVWFESNLMRWIRTYWMALLNIRLRQIQRGLTLWCKITAKRSFNDGDLKRSRKNLLHSIRYLKYAIHITKDKKIVKYRNAKKFHQLFFEKTKEFNLWREYEEMFRPIHKLFKSKLNDACYEIFKSSQTFSNEIMNEIIEKSIPSTAFLEYCKRYGVTELARDFSIVVSPLFESKKEQQEKQVILGEQQSSPTAISLIEGTYHIPQDQSIIDLIKKESFISTKLVKMITHREVHKRLDDLIPLQECWNGSIVEMHPPSDWTNTLDRANMKLVAHPYKYFFQYDSDACDNILLKTNSKPVENQSIQVTMKYVGTMCMLFYHDNEWRISTNQSQDWEYLYGRSDPSTMNKNDTQTDFWKVFEEGGYLLPEDTTKCFMFTLSSVPFLSEGDSSSNFSSRELIAHGCRDMKTLKEESIQPHAERYNWKHPEIIEIIPKGPYFDIVEQTKYKPKKRPLNANMWRKKPDDICVNLPLFKVFEKYMELANDFSTMDPERYSGFILCDQDFVRVKIETGIYYSMSYLELFRDSETQETSVDSENNQMYMIEMVRNLKSFLSESVQELVNSGGDLSTLSEMTTDLKLVKHYVPEFFNLYVEYRNLYKITCNLMNVVHAKIQQVVQQQIENGTLKEEDINKVYPDLVKEYSPLSRTFPLMYMRKNQIDNCFNLFTRKNYLHTEAIHNLLTECRQKIDKVLPFLTE